MFHCSNQKVWKPPLFLPFLSLMPAYLTIWAFNRYLSKRISWFPSLNLLLCSSSISKRVIVCPGAQGHQLQVIFESNHRCYSRIYFPSETYSESTYTHPSVPFGSMPTLYLAQITAFPATFLQSILHTATGAIIFKNWLHFHNGFLLYSLGWTPTYFLLDPLNLQWLSQLFHFL